MLRPVRSLLPEWPCSVSEHAGEQKEESPHHFEEDNASHPLEGTEESAESPRHASRGPAGGAS